MYHYACIINYQPKQKEIMRRSIWIPKKEYTAIKEAAKKASETGGVGAYLVKLHKEEQNRKDDGK